MLMAPGSGGFDIEDREPRVRDRLGEDELDRIVEGGFKRAFRDFIHQMHGDSHALKVTEELERAAVERARCHNRIPCKCP